MRNSQLWNTGSPTASSCKKNAAIPLSGGDKPAPRRPCTRPDHAINHPTKLINIFRPACDRLQRLRTTTSTALLRHRSSPPPPVPGCKATQQRAITHAAYIYRPIRGDLIAYARSRNSRHLLPTALHSISPPTGDYAVDFDKNQAPPHSGFRFPCSDTGCSVAGGCGSRFSTRANVAR